MAASQREDWAAILDRLIDGDRVALLKLTRLVNGFFARWNAYDFRDDWEDLIQEVLLAALRAQRDGRIDERDHVYGFLKTIARNKFVDRLKSHLRSPADKTLPWEEIVDGELDPGTMEPEPELALDVEAALAALEDRRRRVVLAVYVEGKTHQQAVEATSVPLGTLRRDLREGLAQLQRALGPPSALSSDPSEER
jgi:RNA polymerase sigma factor (sigma-70 family)